MQCGLACATTSAGAVLQNRLLMNSMIQCEIFLVVPGGGGASHTEVDLKAVHSIVLPPALADSLDEIL